MAVQPATAIPEWDDDYGLTEAQKVLRWRYRTLRDVGYDRVEARWIADSPADLHLAVELVARGCSHALAVEILT